MLLAFRAVEKSAEHIQKYSGGGLKQNKKIKRIKKR
jgi:hypothetical protein